MLCIRIYVCVYTCIYMCHRHTYACSNAWTHLVCCILRAAEANIRERAVVDDQQPSEAGLDAVAKAGYRGSYNERGALHILQSPKDGEVDRLREQLTLKVEVGDDVRLAMGARIVVCFPASHRKCTCCQRVQAH